MPEKKGTKTLDLTDAFLHEGATYGPGEGVEVPENFPDDAQERLDATRKGVERPERVSPQSPPGASGSGVEQTVDTVNAQGTAIGAVERARQAEPLTGDQKPKGGAKKTANGEEGEDEFKGKTKDELADMAADRGLEVTRGDGEEGEPKKEDYLRALRGGK